MATTAYDLIVRSMRLAKILAVGETPTADEANDALLVLNGILENWDTEPLSLWSDANATGTLVPGQATYTVGPTGNFPIDRFGRLRDAYVVYQTVSYPLEVIGQYEYNEIPIKEMGSVLPQRVMYLNDFPNGLLTLWPVPTTAMPIYMTVDKVLTQIPDLQTSINYPPGAALALRYELAVQLATEYGAPMGPELVAQAKAFKGDYKRANKSVRQSRVDAAWAPGSNFFNYYSGV